MMLFFWWFFLLPFDKPVCALWVSQEPTQAQMVQACGEWPVPNVDQMIWRAVDVKTGQVLCELPATQLPAVGCNLTLNQVRIEIIWPDFVSVAGGCSIVIDHEGEPTVDEAFAQCSDLARQWQAGELTLELVSQSQQPVNPEPAATCQMPALATGPGLLDMPQTATDLITTTPYELLAGALLWNGLSRPSCGGLSGLQTVFPFTTTECGMESALPKVLEYQNRYDTEIFRVSQITQVPPRLLKAMIANESQFWTGWQSSAGETGLLQITDAGADVALRYSPALYQRFCIFTACGNGYDLLTNATQTYLRQQVLQAEEMLVNAQIVAAYYCYANELSSQPMPAARWDITLAVWNAGADCVSSGTICQEGIKYINDVQGE